MSKVIKHHFVFILFLLTNNIIDAQIKKENIKWGISYGTGVNKYPFKSKDYSHEVDFYKVVINYKIIQKKRWSYEINLEPSYNIAEHQLLNKWFIKDTDSEDYLELRDLYTQKRTIKEYVLNIGFVARYSFFKTFSGYAIGSIGPMISDKATERLAKGYAFSDVFGLGLSCHIRKTQLNLGYSIRHTSNLELKSPNNGHDSTNIEFSILYKL